MMVPLTEDMARFSRDFSVKLPLFMEYSFCFVLFSKHAKHPIRQEKREEGACAVISTLQGIATLLMPKRVRQFTKGRRGKEKR